MRRDGGTVFIDTLVAAAIVALALGMLYRVVGASAHRSVALADRRMALLIAQSELANVGAEIAAAPGTTEGIQGPFAWRVEIAPDPATSAASNTGRLMSVTVSVARRGEPALVSLRTLRLEPAS